MRDPIKSILTALLHLIDLAASILVIPAAHLLLIYRKTGSGRLPRTTSRLKSIGLFPVRNHYYEPLFVDKLLSRPLDSVRPLPGIDFNVDGQLKLLKSLTFESELVALDLERNSGPADYFNINNKSFASGDAEFLYQLLRFIKPRKLVEIGSGNSTKIARIALIKNKLETNSPCEHICVEPYEIPELERLDGLTVIRSRLEDCRFDWANNLDSGDLLFIDSSHVIRPQGDVLKEYLEILPLLKAGVYVHIHDIFSPRDYLTSWVVDDVKFWNEQYLLEALLTNTNRYEVVAALNSLKHTHYDLLSRVCPYMTEEREPGSFYLRIKS